MKQTLLITVNKDYCRTFAVYQITFFPFQRHGAVHATQSLTCAPMCPSSLNRKTTAKQSGSKSRRLFNAGALRQMMLSQNLRHWPAELHANQLLGSAKPGNDAW